MSEIPHGLLGKAYVPTLIVIAVIAVLMAVAIVTIT